MKLAGTVTMPCPQERTGHSAEFAISYNDVLLAIQLCQTILATYATDRPCRKLWAELRAHCGDEHHWVTAIAIQAGGESKGYAMLLQHALLKSYARRPDATAFYVDIKCD